MDDRYFDDLADMPNLRSVSFTDAEMTDDGNEFRFDGIAAPTGYVADIGEFSEEYERGSFRRFLSSNTANIPFLHEHNPRDLLATTKSGRLQLSEDGRGLRARANVVKTDLSERVKALVDAGDIGGMSIGMIVGRENQKISTRSGKPHRKIVNFRRLLDVCTTFDPAYAATEAQFRSASLALADSPASLQHLLLGAIPQLEARATTPDGIEDEEAPPPEPEEEEAPVKEGESGATEERSVAARKRQLSFYVLTTGGIDDAP